MVWVVEGQGFSPTTESFGVSQKDDSGGGLEQLSEGEPSGTRGVPGRLDPDALIFITEVAPKMGGVSPFPRKPRLTLEGKTGGTVWGSVRHVCDVGPGAPMESPKMGTAGFNPTIFG